MSDFRNVVSDCGLEDLPVTGPPITWHKRIGSELIFERLDKCLATNSWCSLFPYSIEEHLITYTSDHLPILLKVLASDSVHQGRRNGNFKFENMWCNSTECGEIVKEVWNSTMPSSLSGISQNLSSCASRLHRWNREKLQNLSHRFKEK
ncbi:hypothetical protein REPUB_Repub11eG0072800 [Reevesia pubescens]